MDHTRINEALKSATDTVEVLVEDGAIDQVGAVFARTFPDRSGVVVADATTWGVAGEEVASSLEAAGVRTAQPYVYDEATPYAKHENVIPLVESLRGHDAIPVALGAGTLNDMAKRAAFEVDRPYLVVGTAASMDGYTSFGASLAKGGHKQTMECPAPTVFVADMQVLVDAPDRLTASGYGDLIGKVPAGADWIIADALGIDPIDDAVWDRVQGPLRQAIADPAGLRAGDRGPMEHLIEGLVMSGLAMQAAQSSRPASGAEHQFSHLWEMEGHGVDQDPPLSHGFKVGLGTIAIAALYERVLARDLSDIDVEAAVAAWPGPDEMEASVRAVHDKILSVALDQTMGKYVDADALGDRLRTLTQVWPQIRGRIEDQLLPPEELEQMLSAAGCPTTPSQIGLDFDAFRATYSRAQMIRTRYTILDVVREAGILDECVDELFAEGGYWADPSRR